MDLNPDLSDRSAIRTACENNRPTPDPIHLDSQLRDSYLGQHATKRLLRKPSQSYSVCHWWNGSG